MENPQVAEIARAMNNIGGTRWPSINMNGSRMINAKVVPTISCTSRPALEMKRELTIPKTRPAAQ